MTSATDDSSGPHYAVLTHLGVSSITRISLTPSTRQVSGKAILEATISSPLVQWFTRVRGRCSWPKSLADHDIHPVRQKSLGRIRWFLGGSKKSVAPLENLSLSMAELCLTLNSFRQDRQTSAKPSSFRKIQYASPQTLSSNFQYKFNWQSKLLSKKLWWLDLLTPPPRCFAEI